jgi:hypothetical protein
MIASIVNQMSDVEFSSVLVGSTIILASAMLVRGSIDRRVPTKTKLSTLAQSQSATLYLPKVHHLSKVELDSHNNKRPPMISTNNDDDIEISLRKEIKSLVTREAKLRRDLESERSTVESLSKQVKDILHEYEEAGDYSGIFGKSKQMVEREHRGYKKSKDAEQNSLHLKLAELEYQATMTRRALEKSRAQTEMAQQAASPRNGGRRSPAHVSLNRVTYDEHISQMTLLREAIALIRSETMKFDSESIKRVSETLEKITTSCDSASILMGRSLGVVKATLTEFCGLDTFTKTNTAWNVPLTTLVKVPRRRRKTMVDSLTLAVAAFDTMVREDEELQIEESVVDGFCLNCSLLATLSEFAFLSNDECTKRASERENHKIMVRTFDRRGSTIALQAAGLIPETPTNH